MGNWYGVMISRKFFKFDLKISDSFNIETLSKVSFSRPQIILGFKKLYSKKTKWDANISVIGVYPNYSIAYDTTTISSESVVQILFIEGDIVE